MFHQSPHKPNTIEKMNEAYAREFGAGILPSGSTPIKREYIKDIPVLEMANGTIVCIPKMPEVACMACIGQSGKGKTLLLGGIMGRIFYGWEDNVSNMNDTQDESYVNSEPQDYPEFIFDLKKIGQKPMPLPMIYCIPNSDKYKTDEKMLENKNYVNISIPFKEVINHIENFIDNLAGSEKYIVEKKEALLTVTAENEIFEIIKTIGEGLEVPVKGLEAVKVKLNAEFNNLMEEGILNISNRDAPSEITVKRQDKEIYSGNPITAIMKANCIPSLITSDLSSQKHRDAILSYYINQLFEESREGAMKGGRVWLNFDELNKVVNADPQFTAPLTETALTNIAERGRNHGIAIIYGAHRYSAVPKRIRDQTKFAIAFRHKNRDETKSIREDFGVPKEIQEELLTLKKYEAYALTTEYFICYGDNGRTWQETKPLKGKIIMPQQKNRFLHKKEEEDEN